MAEINPHSPRHDPLTDAEYRYHVVTGKSYQAADQTAKDSLKEKVSQAADKVVARVREGLSSSPSREQQERLKVLGDRARKAGEDILQQTTILEGLSDVPSRGLSQDRLAELIIALMVVNDTPHLREKVPAEVVSVLDDTIQLIEKGGKQADQTNTAHQRNEEIEHAIGSLASCLLDEVRK